jgi:ferredoxin--NADP+ reductase
MYPIITKEELAPQVKLMKVKAPAIAKKALAGQFVIFRIHEEGERIPLTLADWDAQAGTVTLIFQEVGKSTDHLGSLKVGDVLQDLIGPLGIASEIENFGTVACIGGGIGTAPVYPIARALKQAGNRVISIIGARSKNLLIWEDMMRAQSHELFVTTDDGSYGRHGFVTNQLLALIDNGTKIDLCLAIGPPVMMKAVCEVTAPHKIPTRVSLDSIMVDGTGMCGACRVTVGGKTRFVCVDGPEFDGHQVDFNEYLARKRIYLPEERRARDAFRETCCKGGKA